jgi:hypothetical protein
MKIRFPQRRYPAMIKPNQKKANDERKQHNQEQWEAHKIRIAVKQKSRHRK